jgi:hypothetical protein
MIAPIADKSWFMNRLFSVLGAIAVTSLVSTASSSQPGGWTTYNDPQAGFSISYPPGWRIDRRFVYVGFGPDHEIHGVAFQIPQTLAKGTNLSSSLTGVSVDTVPAGRACDAARFIPDPNDLRTLKNAGRVWSTANTQDAGAGNFYDSAVFALPGTEPCLAVRYLIHSTNIGNYDPGTVREFDRAALIRTFAAIRHTLRLRTDR